MGYALSGIILALGITGARLQNNIPLYIMLALIAVSLILVVFDRIKEKQYPVLIYCTCLGLIYQLSLLTNFLTGTDIHYEYYFALQTYGANGHWDYTIQHSYNAAMSISVFIPVLAQALHIPLEWAFKIIPPLFMSGVPVIVYYIAKKEFDSKTAFLAVFFFISVPTMFLELSGLAKQAIGELFLAACLGLVIYDVFSLKWARYVFIGMLGILAIVSHYSMGGSLMCFLIGAIILLLVGRFIFKRKAGIHVGYLSLVVALVFGFGVLFYGSTAQGVPLDDITGAASSQLGIISPSTVETGNATQFISEVESPTYESHWQYPEPAVALALGGDFASVSTIPRVFRIFQYITEALIIIGVGVILWHYKRHSLGYIVMVILGGGLLAMVAFAPGFSPIFNATRFYNLALLFLAPAVVVGGRLIFRSYKVLAILILIPYFAFTSGAVFELMETQSINTISVPYSHALSAIRTDSTALFTEHDIEARDWIKANNAFPVYGDLWGSTAISEVQSNLGETTYVYYLIYIQSEGQPKQVPDDCYIYLRERNTENEEITYYTGVGLRRTNSYAEVGFYNVLDGRPLVFQSGNAMVYGPKES